MKNKTCFHDIWTFNLICREVGLEIRSNLIINSRDDPSMPFLQLTNQCTSLNIINFLITEDTKTHAVTLVKRDSNI